jgi:hypothetical protein
MTDIRGIHYEISKPILNDADGYYYQRRRQVDDHGNLVGEGDQLIRLQKPGSQDGQYVPGLDWAKIGKLGGDVGQVGYGIVRRDPAAAARGASSFTNDIRGGVHQDYKSWPGTERPWEHDDIPAPPFDNRSSLDLPFANATVVPGNPNSPASSPESEGPIGFVGGKPMRFPFAPIFDTRDRSGATGDPNRSNALDDLISNFGRWQAPSLNADAAAPPVPNRRIASIDGNDSNASSNGPDTAFTPPVSAQQNPQGPLSLNDAYLEHLKRLNANQPQAPASDSNAPPLAPLDDSSFSGGLPGRLAALLGVDPQNPDQPAPPPSDDDLRAFYGDLMRPWFLQGQR